MSYQLPAERLTRILGLAHPPIAIGFADVVPGDVPRYNQSYPPPAANGRTGAVPAGCVFWVKATEASFATVPEDHGNCSVGSLTHGLVSLAEAAGKADVATLVEAGWVTPAAFPAIAAVQKKYPFIVYGPLAGAGEPIDMAFIRINAKQAMMLSDAWPCLRFEGKPQCHIIAIAKAHDEIALSVGCMLSRVRTGIGNNEMTCAIPVARLPELLDRLEAAAAADRQVAAYAAGDAQRFIAPAAASAAAAGHPD